MFVFGQSVSSLFCQVDFFGTDHIAGCRSLLCVFQVNSFHLSVNFFSGILTSFNISDCFVDLLIYF